MKVKCLTPAIATLAVFGCWQVSSQPIPPVGETLIGNDIDGNAIRDDIDAWIEALGLAEKPLEMVNLKAQGMHAILTMNLNDNGEIARHATNGLKAIACLANLMPDRAFIISRQLEERTFNTRDRVRRLKQHSRAASGSLISYPSGNPCDEHR